MFENIRADIKRARLANVGQSWFDQRIKILFQLTTWPIVAYRFSRWALTYPVPVLRYLLLIAATVCRGFAQFLTGVYISPKAQIGPGLVVHTIYGVFVGARKIGANCLLQTGVLIQYGSAPIGDNVFFGAGAKVIATAAIGNNVRIGPNSLVVTDVPDNITVVGVPARIRLPYGRKLWFEQRSSNADEAHPNPTKGQR